MRVVLGLGNPGPEYAETRHNVGFRVVEEIARRHDARLDRLLCNAWLGDAGDLLLAAPQTFMNRSGHAARCLAERFEIAASSMLVVYDEIHLPLARLRLRPKGSPAGHRGMESIISCLGTAEVPRLRLGVGAPEDPEQLVDHVLAPFDEDERSAVAEMVERGADACEVWAQDGAEAAMQAFNG